MSAAVTDPALAAILQRRRLLSEPQLSQVATWPEEHTLTEDAGTESTSQQHHSMLIRPGIVQEALTAIQERPSGPTKPDEPVQCFDMATDSESEEESCASDSGLDPGHMPGQSSESTCIGDEDISSCGERPRTRIAADSLQDSTLAGEVRAAELMTGLTRAATVADLRLAVQQRISSEENVTLLTTSGGAYVPLLDDEVIGGLFDDVEDVVIQGHVFVLSGPRSGAEATRPSILEAENAQLRAQIVTLERRLAESESTQRDRQVQEQADNSVQLVPEPIPGHTPDAAEEGPEEGEPPAIDDVEAESVPASSAAGLPEAGHCQPAPEAAAAEAAADVAPASPEPERDPSAAPGFQPGKSGMPSKCPGGPGYGRKGAWYGQAYPAAAMGMASPAAANGTGIAPTLEGTGAWGAGYAAQGNPAWGAGYGAYGRGPWRQGYGAYGKGAWGQGYGGAYGKGAWGQRYGGAYGKGAWGQGYGAYGKGAWGQKYPAAATGYPAYGAGAWGKNAYGQGFPTAAMGKASPTVMTNGTSKAPAKGKGAWGSSYGAYGKAAWGHHKAAAGKTGTGNIATGAYGKGKGAWGRYGGKGYGAWGHSMSPGAAQQGLGAYGKGFAAFHAKKVKAASVPGQLPSSPAKTAAPGQTPAAPAALSAGQAPTPTAPAALKLGGAPVNPLYAKYWSKYYRNLYKGKWMKYYGGMKGGFNYYKPWSPHYRWLWGKLYGRFYGRKFISRRFGYRGHHLSGLAKWWWWKHPHPGPTTTTTTGTFTCLDGSGCEIPAIFQDDTFCDCPDCSDESQYTCATCPTTHTQTTSSTTSSVTATVTVVTSTVTVVTSTVTAVTTTSTTEAQVGPAPPPFIPPGGDAALGAALGSTLGAALAVTLGVGIGLSTGLGIFFAIGSFRLNVPNAGAFRKDADAIAALKKTVARIAGPNIDSSTIELTLPCENAKRRLDVRSALRRLDETVGVCFRIQIRGEEASTNVCERLSGFNSGSAQRILSEELSNLPGRSVQVVSWDAQPNPIAYNPNQNVGGDDSGLFDPSQAGISLG